MILRTLLQSLSRLPVHMVGIKGTGMSALAEILVRRGAVVTGSDTGEVFYTDAILRSLSIPVYSGFSAEHLPKDVALVIHSAAYDRAVNPELVEAIRRGIPVVSYPEALGGLSSLYHSVGISGVHGKTTTTAIAGTLASALGLKATILAGSAVSNFGGRSTLFLG
ncbi:MAG TPA: Mur ligase domain-containing protein, partial [Spirochaetia bacterium]|nr:Mur ligase domain-containing protein [Spirochaetia bacterium]